MNKLCILVGASLFGWIGWKLGLHLGVMAAYLLSVVGSAIGVYVGWRLHRDLLE